MDVLLGFSEGQWEEGWSCVAPFTATCEAAGAAAAPSSGLRPEAAQTFVVYAHSALTRRWAVKEARVDEETGGWGFATLREWEGAAGYTSLVALHRASSPLALSGTPPGGHLFAHCRETKRYKLMRVDASGREHTTLRKGTLPSAWTNLVAYHPPVQDAEPHLLLYDAASGLHSTLEIPSLRVLHTGRFHKGYTDIVAKSLAPCKWRVGGEDGASVAAAAVARHRYRFYCYASAAGVAGFEELMLGGGSKEASAAVEDAGPTSCAGVDAGERAAGKGEVGGAGVGSGNDNGDEGAGCGGKPVKFAKVKKGCMVVSVDCGGKACCLLYRHTPGGGAGATAAAAGAAAPVSQSNGAAADQDCPETDPVSQLRQRIRCARDAWTTVAPFPLLPVVDAAQTRHVFCYSSATGAWWASAVRSEAPTAQAAAAGRRSSAAHAHHRGSSADAASSAAAAQRPSAVSADPSPAEQRRARRAATLHSPSPLQEAIFADAHESNWPKYRMRAAGHHRPVTAPLTRCVSSVAAGDVGGGGGGGSATPEVRLRSCDEFSGTVYGRLDAADAAAAAAAAAAATADGDGDGTPPPPAPQQRRPTPPPPKPAAERVDWHRPWSHWQYGLGAASACYAAGKAPPDLAGDEPPAASAAAAAAAATTGAEEKGSGAEEEEEDEDMGTLRVLRGLSTLDFYASTGYADAAASALVAQVDRETERAREAAEEEARRPSDARTPWAATWPRRGSAASGAQAPGAKARRMEACVARRRKSGAAGGAAGGQDAAAAAAVAEARLARLATPVDVEKFRQRQLAAMHEAAEAERLRALPTPARRQAAARRRKYSRVQTEKTAAARLYAEVGRREKALAALRARYHAPPEGAEPPRQALLADITHRLYVTQVQGRANCVARLQEQYGAQPVETRRHTRGSQKECVNRMHTAAVMRREAQQARRREVLCTQLATIGVQRAYTRAELDETVQRLYVPQPPASNRSPPLASPGAVSAADTAAF